MLSRAENQAGDGTLLQDLVCERIRLIREFRTNYADYKKKGHVYPDVTGMWAEPRISKLVTFQLEGILQALTVDYVVALTSMGFAIGGLASGAVGVPLIQLRTRGKRPGWGLVRWYSMQYSSDKCLALSGREMHLLRGKRVLVIDDVTESGGTLQAACELLVMAEAHVVGGYVLVDVFSEQSGIPKVNSLKLFDGKVPNPSPNYPQIEVPIYNGAQLEVVSLERALELEFERFDTYTEELEAVLNDRDSARDLWKYMRKFVQHEIVGERARAIQERVRSEWVDDLEIRERKKALLKRLGLAFLIDYLC